VCVVSRAADLRRLLNGRRRHLLDGVLAVALVAASTEVVANAQADVSGWWELSVIPLAALFSRHRWPVPALLLAGVGAALHWLVYLEARIFPQPIDLAGLFVLFSVASRARSRRLSLAVCAATIAIVYAGSVLHVVVLGHRRSPVDAASILAWLTPSNGQIIGLMTVIIVFVLGDSARSRRIHLSTLEQRAADLEREHQQRAALAAAAERARIARDLHDIVAHRVTGMVVQAGAARLILDGEPAPAVQALHAVEEGGRAAMVELRGLLGLLTTLNNDALRTPAPSIAVLPDLIANAGLPVRLNVRGDLATLPHGLDLAAFRIVQEALTNALRHSTRTGTSVDVWVDNDALRIEVLDDAPAPPTSPDDGRGLVGMRERVATYAGSLTAGPRPDGRWQVRATLPIPRPDPPRAIR
jgi:signal transduction histidine kinase